MPSDILAGNTGSTEPKHQRLHNAIRKLGEEIEEIKEFLDFLDGDNEVAPKSSTNPTSSRSFAEVLDDSPDQIYDAAMRVQGLQQRLRAMLLG